MKFTYTCVDHEILKDDKPLTSEEVVKELCKKDHEIDNHLQYEFQLHEYHRFYDKVVYNIIKRGNLILPCLKCESKSIPIYEDQSIFCSNPVCNNEIHGVPRIGMALIDWNHYNKDNSDGNLEERIPTIDSRTDIERLIDEMFEYKKTQEDR